MAFTRRQADLFRQGLLKLDPPVVVLEKFDRLVEIAQEIESEDRLEDLLKDACRIANWTRPWETEQTRLTFRASRLDSEHPEYFSDVGGSNSPAIEQAYRRGVSHGLATARQILNLKYGSDHPVAVEELSVGRWRRAELHDRDTLAWGSFAEPDYPCQLRSTARRSGMSLRKRWDVLLRDGRKCTVCGASAASGVVLEVDHIVSVADGGSDDVPNLRTLCFDCNRGKAASSDQYGNEI